MRAIPRLVLLAALAPAALHAADPPAEPRNRGEAKEMFTADGLTQVKVKGLDVAYARPGASLAEYKRILVLPVEVSLRKDWARSASGGRMRPKPGEVEVIRERVGRYVREEFEKELAAAGIEQAQAPGDDVLAVSLSIKDLYAAAPNLQSAYQSDVYALSAGEITLVGELRDSVTGEAEFRFYDHEEGDQRTRAPRRIYFNENETETRLIARDWARLMRTAVQTARAAPPAEGRTVPNPE